MFYGFIYNLMLKCLRMSIEQLFNFFGLDNLFFLTKKLCTNYRAEYIRGWTY